jgi:GMP synthase-like glutamine amidotransferase
MRPTVLLIQHGDRDALGHAGRVVADTGCALDVRNVHKGHELPASLDGYAGVLVYGGPQDAWTDEGFPTRRHEIALIEEALRDDVPLLGICLGAQLLAQACGVEGYRGPIREVGWQPVTVTDAAAEDELWSGVPSEFRVMQNHHNHYPLPEDAVLLAKGCLDYPYQVFRVGETAWGMQFHLEADGVSAFPAGMDEVGAFDAIAPVAEHVFGRFGALAVASQELVAA